jgi:glycosyltransferase involved in cell wall biosynthesis
MNQTKSAQMVKHSTTLLQVVPSLETGGVETGTIELAEALKKEGYTPLVASNGGILVQKLSQDSILHLTLPLHSKNPLQMIVNIFHLLKVIKRHKVALLHVRSRAPAWSAKFACRLAHIPLVTTFHGAYNFHNKIKRFYNAIMVQGDHVIAVSTFIKNHILQNYRDYVEEERITVIPRGIDLKRYHRPSISQERIDLLRQRWHLRPDIPFIFMPARLTRWKGQLTLLKALHLLKQEKRAFQSVLAGSSQGRSDYKKELEKFLKQYDLEKEVLIDEHCTDIPAAYALSDAVVHASTDPEAFGRVVVEAQAAGVPIIASRLGAPAEVIDNDQTGWLHEAGNAQDLARQIRKVLGLTPVEKEKILKNATEKAQQEYDNQLMFRRTMQVYETLLKIEHP